MLGQRTFAGGYNCGAIRVGFVLSLETTNLSRSVVEAIWTVFILGGVAENWNSGMVRFERSTDVVHKHVLRKID